MHYVLSRMSHRQLSIGLALVLLFVSILTPQAQPAEAALSLPSGFQSESIVGNMTLPTAIAWAPDKRMFIAQKNGIVRIVADGTQKNSTPLATPFIDISARVNNNTDRGLLGIAVDPQFPTRPYVYLLYSYDPPGLPTSPSSSASDGNGSRVAQLLRVEADSSNGYNVAKTDPATQVVLLGKNSTLANSGDVSSQSGAQACMSTDATPVPVQDCLPSDYESHSVGAVRFADDGSLFVSIGDGSSNNPSGDLRSFRAQNLDSLSGKILRINPDTGAAYSDNPFYNGDTQSNRSKVWSYGLRNPFRFTVKPGTTEVYLGDVELSTWEEIDTGKGKNFGWPCYEGGDTGNVKLILYQNNAQCTQLYSQSSTVQAPLYAYQHPDYGSYKEQRAVIGGDFYSGTSYPAAYRNALFFADYAADDMSYLTFDGTGKATVNTFGSDFQDLGNGGTVQIIAGPDTNLYYVLLTAEAPTSGQVRRLTYTGGTNAAPVAKATATPTSGTTPLTVSFSAAGSADPNPGDTLTYTWTFGDGGTGAGISVSHKYTTSGVFSAILTVSDGSLSDTKTIAINVGNTAPTAVIDTPILGTTFNGGDSFTFTGKGTDPEDGTINTDNQLHWSFVFHHNQHTHPNAYPDVAGKSATITIPNDHGNNFWIEACLTATDSKGLNSTPKCQQYYPNTTTYTFQTAPPGLTLSRGEGYTSIAPFTEPLVVNGVYYLVAPQIQQHRSFDHWQDGSTASDRTLIGSATPQTFTATYVNKPPVALPALASSSPTTQAPLTFSNASYDPEDLAVGLTYLWDFGDGTTSTDLAPTHTYARPGTYNVGLTVTDVLGATARTTITVGLPNQLPTAGMNVSINEAGAATTYRIGQTLNLRSTASDADSVIADSNIKWEIIRYHDGISETLAMLSGLSATFTVPDTTAKAAGAQNPLLQRALSDPSTESIEVRQTVIDNNGGSATMSAKLSPQLASVSVAATPAGLAVQLNGEPSATALTRTFIAGATVTLSAPATQTLDGVTYTLSGWSDGGASEHTVVAGAAATYTATYAKQATGATTPSGTKTMLWLPLAVR